MRQYGSLIAMAMLVSPNACMEERSNAQAIVSSEYMERKAVFARLLKDTADLGANKDAASQATFECVKRRLAEDQIDSGVVFALVDAFYEVLDKPEDLTKEQRTNMANAVVLTQKYVRECAPAPPP